MRVDADVWDLLCQCEQHRRATGGCFDVSAVSGASGDALILDEEQQSVRFARPGVFIDLGGVAKGYALDRGAEILRRFGVSTGLLNGGTSSLLAVGRHPDGDGWPVDVRDPFREDAAPVARLLLADQAFSCSAVFSPGQAVSDVIAPRGGESLAEQAGCVVVAPTATDAEALSTACLVMGKERARRYVEGSPGPGVTIGWIDAPDGAARLEWLTEAP